MPKYLYLTLSIIALSLPAKNSQAQTCGTAPTCESLGYTKTSTDCKEYESLKCPFDQSKFFCPEIPVEVACSKPGVIFNSDSTCTSKKVSSKTPVGIYIGSGMVMSIEYRSGNYQSNQSFCSGSISGVGGWRIPSYGELQPIYNNRDLINAQFKILGKQEMLKRGGHSNQDTNLWANYSFTCGYQNCCQCNEALRFYDGSKGDCNNKSCGWTDARIYCVKNI